MNKEVENNIKSKSDEELDKFISSQPWTTESHKLAVEERNKRLLMKRSTSKWLVVLSVISCIIIGLAGLIISYLVYVK